MARLVAAGEDHPERPLVRAGPDRTRRLVHQVLDAIRRADLFATLVPEDTYQVASELHDLLVKTHPADVGKIELIKELVWDGLKLDPILEAASEAVFA